MDSGQRGMNAVADYHQSWERILAKPGIKPATTCSLVCNTTDLAMRLSRKYLDWSKLKGFADNKMNVTEKLKFVLGRVENIVGKGENAGIQHFLLFPQCFQKFFLQLC